MTNPISISDKIKEISLQYLHDESDSVDINEAIAEAKKTSKKQ
ncbi:MAG: hypothetical protein AABY15_07850 [Nanoarchaeota archaeon]